MKNKPKLISLLEAASEDRNDLKLGEFTGEEIQCILETGLGPLLLRATRNNPGPSASLLQPLLQGADLTARLLTAEQLDATAEILDVCEGRTEDLTLLKGISIADSYPEPHLRPMRDLDFLVRESDIAIIESQLHQLGYVPKSEQPARFFESFHHSAPLYHPRRGVWVELHRELFPPQNELRSDTVFGQHNLRSQTRRSKFRGRDVGRLSNELQVVYTACHWAQNWKVGGLIGLLDLIHLFRCANDEFDWELVLSWLHGTASSSYVYFALSYLQKHQLINLDAQIRKRLFSRQRSFGGLNLKILYLVVDHFLGGKAQEDERISWRLGVIWETLLRPGSPFRNLLLAFWGVLPFGLSRKLRKLLHKDHLSAPRAVATL